MVNDYINYLNSMNNANSSNENALAEAQITNPYYEKIRVERNLGKYLAQKIKNKPTSIILTGHAGDGKTSLIYQILRQFDLLEANKNLKVADELYSERMGKSIFYVKDMSELSEVEQEKLLLKCLNAKKEGNSSILVSNTGPLLNTFKRVNDSPEIEMKLLELMDENEGIESNVAGHEILLINMARIDNVVLAPKLLKKLLSEELWNPCNQCEKNSMCPIYNNYQTINNNIENVNNVLSAFYRWLFENDRRLTVRQILSHLSYSITGNLDCSDVAENQSEFQNVVHKFNYHSSNLFFGYIGIENDDESNQIQAIREIQHLKLDSKELHKDYSLFVKQDFSYLSREVQSIAEQIWAKYHREYTHNSLNLLKDEKPYKLRKAIRRMQIMFGMHDIDSLNTLYSSLFSPVFAKFLLIRNEEIGTRENRELRNKITKALYFIFVGSLNGYENSDEIYLPLIRYGSGLQNVQLLQGKIEKREIKLIQIYRESIFDEDESHYILNLKFAKVTKSFPVSLMLFDYLDKTSKGAVSTRINPSLSHGIDTMKAKLYEKYKFKDNHTTEVLVHTNNGAKVVRLEVDSYEVFVD
jgi:hypothetical protein